jgi:hypothetical protein
MAKKAHTSHGLTNVKVGNGGRETRNLRQKARVRTTGTAIGREKMEAGNSSKSRKNIIFRKKVGKSGGLWGKICNFGAEL